MVCLRKIFALLIILFSIQLIFAVKITEVEQNPLGKDAGNEWVEFYSNDVADLSEYKIVNNDGKEVLLNGSFSGYYIYTFKSQWLDNSNESVFLYKGVSLVDKTGMLEDQANDNKTWQLCKTWEFLESTKATENKCNKNVKELPDKNSVIESKIEINKTKNIDIKVVEKNKSPEENSLKEEITEIENKSSLSLNAIKLNSKDIKSENANQNSNKNIWGVYGFVIFCILLGFLFIIKKKSSEKNEFR